MRSGAGRASLPRPVTDQRGEVGGLVTAPVGAGQDVVAAGGQHERHLAGGQPAAEDPVLPERLVRGDPAVKDTGAVGAGQHVQSELRLGREPHPAGDTGGRAPVGVLGPRGRHVELAVHQRPAARGAIGQEHPELTVVDLPAGTGVLALHPGRAHALLDEPGVVGDPHPGVVPELVQDVSAQVITHSVDIPLGRAEQALHPVRGHCTRVLGQRPAVLTLQPREQPTQIRPDPAARLDPPEPARDQLHHRIQRRDPPSKIHHAVIITAGQASASHDTPKCRCSIRNSLSPSTG